MPPEDTEEPLMEYVTEAKVLRPYVLELTFSDGTRREVDLEPELYGEVFEPLRDPAFFAQGALDPVIGTVVWPNGADFSPEFLYSYQAKSQPTL
jgi:hypothetical protein